MGKTSLDDLFSDSPPSSDTPPSPEPVASQEAPEAQASSDPIDSPAPSGDEPPDTPADPPSAEDPPAEPKGDDQDSTGKTNDGPPPSQSSEPQIADDPKVKAFQKKAQQETRKRQDVEKQLKESNDRFSALEKQLAELTARLSQPAHPQAPAQAQSRQPSRQPYPQPRPQGQAPRRPAPPNPDVDPGAAIRYMNTHFQSEIQRRDREWQERELKRTIETSQEIARVRYSDYDDVEQVFAEEAEKNPALFAELYRQPNPAEYAYSMGRRFKALREVGDDPLAWKTQQEEAFEARLAEERQKWEEEMAASRPASQPGPAPARQPAAQPKRPAPPAPPPSLAGVTSQAPRNPSARFDGPTPLDKLLG